MLTAGIIELVAEAVVFLEAYGVDADTTFKELGGGLAGSAVLERRAPDMLPGNSGLVSSQPAP